MSAPRPVAVLGTGAMGLPVAQRLVARGHAVRVWNRTEARSAALTGAQRCSTPQSAAAGCGHVLMALADDAALQDVLLGRHRLVEGLSEGQVVLLLGTVAPGTVREAAAAVAGRGAVLLDVGMLGNAAHAAHGELRLFVGGEPDDVQRAGALLGEIAKQVVHVGPLGSGMATKLVLNLVMGLEMQALAEAAALGEGLGLDRNRVLDAIGGSGFASPVMRFKAERMKAQAYDSPDFRLALMAKDLLLAELAAADHGLDLPMTGAAAGSHRRAVAAGRSEDDCAAIAEALRPEGLPVSAGAS